MTPNPRLQSASAWAGIIAVAATVAGIVLAHAQGKPAVLIPLGMWGAAAAVALFALAAAPTIGTQGTPRAATRGALAAAALLAAYGIAVVVWNDTFNPPPKPKEVIRTVEPAPPAPPLVEVTSPRAGDSTVNACFDYAFTAAPPGGWTLITAARRDDERLIYFEGEIARDASGRNWSAGVSLGAGQPDAQDKLFHIYVVMLPDDLAAYLLQTHTRVDPDTKIVQTWWASEKLPPGAVLAETTDVRRSGRMDCA